jgi:alkylated DNA repair dioxygenase AlkB
VDFQTSLFADTAAGSVPLAPERRRLSHGAWLDVQRNWLGDPDSVFAALVDRVPWRAERREMYDAVVDVPRLVHTYLADDALPHPALAQARSGLSEHYLPELREPFVTAGCCYYRDGRDSVAWHGDTFGRGSTDDVMVAIVSVGAPRAFMLRPRGGGPSIRYDVGHGDLLVMGGSAQRTWEHAVTKTARQVGPRISIQFRPREVR